MDNFEKYSSRKNFLVDNGFTGEVAPQTWALFADHNNKLVFVGVNSLDIEKTLVVGYSWEHTQTGRKNGNYKKALNCIELVENQNYGVLGFHFSFTKSLYSKPTPHYLVKKNDGWHAIPKDIDNNKFIDLADEVDVSSTNPFYGSRTPKKLKKIGNVYERDVRVAAQTLLLAGGMCELCEKPTFLKTNGKPFLEVHHVLPLSNGGSDTITNTAALCPNCHKELHFGQQSDTLTSKLYDQLPRLVRE
ncbi:HNH endonuclease [Shewanella alkalitolerans]|uniref:HNH endonuclease n=1 Tax=Shewanella alkalitolerans TaxID=2864209 RepID=UPI001C65EF4C|nr:HNH endonuclease [Shewanella alkalitolerans]QYJ98627.1 HNH endonuclease [Shewanella alkalitolerans]